MNFFDTHQGHMLQNYVVHQGTVRSINKQARSSKIASLPLSPLDRMLNPPTNKSFRLSNSYIPLSRRTLVRELLQDKDIVLPSERENFEKLAISLDQKLEHQFDLLQNELSILSQPVDTFNSTNQTQTANNISLPPTSLNFDRLDREFWLIRRLADIASAAGFIEISREQLESLCANNKVRKDGLIAYVDPNDYDVLRFWIRGYHPYSLQSSACNIMNSNLNENQLKLKKNSKLESFYSHLKHMFKRNYSSTEFGKEVTMVNTKFQSNQFSFGRVLMSTRLKQSTNLDLKLFENVPASGLLGKSTFADNLLYLLPNLRTSPLSPIARFVLIGSSVTALTCLGLLSPIAWLFNAKSGLVFAWSFAATTSVGATASLMWTFYWRAQTKLAYRLKQMQYYCCQSSGTQAINEILKLAHEQEFKAALLTYALLLRSTEINSLLTPTQLGIRAESWIAKRLSPQSHISLPSTTYGYLDSISIPGTRFSGGSGPLFDIIFNPSNSLKLLRRLDLVRGSKDLPKAVHLDVACKDIVHDNPNLAGLDRLWIIDPLGKEIDLGSIKT